MPPVIVEGSLHIRVIWTYDGSMLGINSLYANIGSGPNVNSAMASTIAGHLGSAHGDSGLNTHQPPAVSLANVEIRDVRQANQPLLSASVDSPGTGAGDLLPRGNALVVTSRTNLAGRSFRGRTYVPGFDESASDAAGRASSDAQTAASDFLSDFNASMDGEGWPLGVASLVSNNERRDPGIITLIDDFVTRNAVWDRQWRRALR